MPNSLPALVAGILTSDTVWHVRSDAARFEREAVVPAYYIDPELPVEGQAERATLVATELAQKLMRLRDAYANWPVFDPGAYFDLYPPHLHTLCRVEETQAVLRVRLYADLLLPAFRAAERFWVESFLPAYHAGQGGSGANAATDAFREHLSGEAMPRLAALLDAAEQSVSGALALLADNLDVVTFLGGLEERIQHRPRPGSSLAPGLAPALLRLPREMSTLTLDAMFSLPEDRPPGQEVWRSYHQRQSVT